MAVERKNVYVITKGRDDKSYWTRIGVAFVNRDGSLNVKLEAFPVNGELHIRDPKPEDEREEPARRREQGGRPDNRRNGDPDGWRDDPRGGRR